MKTVVSQLELENFLFETLLEDAEERNIQLSDKEQQLMLIAINHTIATLIRVEVLTFKSKEDAEREIL